MTISTSPDRGTFQRESAINRAIADGKDPSKDEVILDLAEYYEQSKKKELEQINDPEWQKDNLEYDLRSTEWIVSKVRENDVYAQNLYAALCNNDFIKAEVWNILTDKRWSCSWRYAGGIIAHMKGRGDYIDWYCSGMSDVSDYVPESTVTLEITVDLKQLGWSVAHD